MELGLGRGEASKGGGGAAAALGGRRGCRIFPRSMSRGNPKGEGGERKSVSSRAKGRGPQAAAWPREGRASFIAAFLSLLVSFLLYRSILHAPFVFDDELHILQNPDIGDFWAFAARSNRPLLALSLVVNFKLGGVDPFGYHLINVILHGLCALLVYLLVKGMPRGGPVLGLLVALGFLSHPLQTESVSYTISRGEVMASLFYCASIVSLRHALIGEGVGRRLAWGALAALFAWLGVASKEVAVTIPVAGFLYDTAFVSRGARMASRKNWRLHLSVCSSWLMTAWLLLTREYEGAGADLQGVGPGRYLATQSGVIFHYLRLVAWPTGLCLDYDWPWAGSLFEPAVVGRLLVLGAILGLGFWLLGKMPEVGFGILWFFLLLAPTRSVLPIVDPIFEHRVYLALVGPLLSFLVAGRALLARAGRGAVAGAAAAWLAVLLVWAALTVARNRLWSDPLLLWQDTVAKAPAKGRPHLQLGKAYVEKCMVEEASREFELAATARYDERGRAKALNNLGGLLIGKGKCPEARPFLERALSHYPRLAAAHYGLALCDVLDSKPLVEQGRLGDAKQLLAGAAGRLEHALSLEPSEAPARFLLASILGALGRRDEAWHHFSWLVRHMPHTEEGRRALEERTNLEKALSGGR